MRKLNQIRRGLIRAVTVALLIGTSFAAESNPDRVVATYSIVGFDPQTGDLGVAVQSKFFGVGSVVPFAEAGIGAIATQSYANMRYGPDGLALLAKGISATAALKQLTDADEDRARRQAGIVDARGQSASFTGAKCMNWAGHIIGSNYCVQGNILAGEKVVQAMASAFEKVRRNPDSELGDWLMLALAAGEAAGGDKRGRQSAALLVVRKNASYGQATDRYIDLRVEDHTEPIEELARLLALHKRFYSHAHHNKPPPPSFEPSGLVADERGESDEHQYGWLMALIVVVVFLAIMLHPTQGTPSQNLGIKDGLLAPCPRAPSCVSSQASDDRHTVKPYALIDTIAKGKSIITQAMLSLPRTALKDEGANYLRFECESWLFRFVDDFEVFFDEKGRLIHVRSSARTGYWDLGVNRNRTELVRQLLPVEMKVGEPKPTSV